MRIRVVLSLLKKEFLNIIRDRKSFIIMILLPLLIFPLLIGLVSVMLTSFTKVDDVIKFGVNYEISEDFKKFVENYSENYDIEIIYDSQKALEEKFDSDELGVYVIKKENTYEIHYDENNTTFLASSAIVENIYNDYKEEYIANTLTNIGVDYDEIKKSFEITFVQESVTEMGSFIPSIISMALIMIISSVCFSVAIDVSTSEKEKGTLETLLSLPIKKAELITSKFITVFVLSCMSGILTYISLFGTLALSGNILSLLGVSGISVSPKVLVIYLVAIVLISLLFSGLLLSVTIFSKNLKEAQNSLYPLELFVTFISMLPMFGVNASIKYSVIPFVNISLLFNNALSSNIDLIFVLLTFGSTIIYSILLITVVSKIYNQEDILFNTKSMNYLTFKNGKSKSICFSVLTSMFIAIVIYLLAMYFSLVFINKSVYFLSAIMPITIVLVIFIAGLIIKLDFKKSFKFNKFHFSKFFHSFMLYVGIYILANLVINIIGRLFPSIVTDYSLIESFLNFDNLVLAILVTALLPAIAEEILFRGVIFNSFNKKYGAMVAILVSALIFGVYHMNWLQGLFAFILGLSLAYVYLKSGSLFVPIILHFINNLIAVLVNHYEVLNFSISSGCGIYLVISALILTILAIYILETPKKE
ncbi:MAG: CPBP family intramembrane metalloprotease [Firmicutes bacterium]|nr:CPBP family intramembrane metalloprotease [Bacillota bacterium]